MANHPTDDVDGSGAAVYPGLRVDLDGMDDFVVAMREEVERNLQPSIERLLTTYEMGVCFGLVTYSPNMDATQKVYHECLTRISTLLGGYVAAGQVLAAAAEQVAREYRNTDAMAAASTQSVSNAISTQIQASQHTPATAELPAPSRLDGRREEL